MRPKREMLEDHAHPCADAREFAVRHGEIVRAHADALTRTETPRRYPEPQAN